MLLNEYEDIRCKLEAELYDEGKSGLYADLISLITTISDYMIASEEARERIGDVMGGKVLELESERLIRIGREEEREEGLKALINTLQGFCSSTDEIYKAVKRNQLYANITREEIEKYMEK